jgi:hypothetical protein
MNQRQYAPATQRNRQPIWEVLSRILPPEGDILEISSGTGEHSVFFAPNIAPRLWIPSDPNPQARDSIIAWKQDLQVENLALPLDIDVTVSEWYKTLKLEIKTIVNINMIHIAPWQACIGLMAGAGTLLSSGGILYLYGPFKQAGDHTALSNVEFDRSLQSRNPEWGVRNLEDVLEVAANNNLQLQEIVTMPANNLSVILVRN